MAKLNKKKFNIGGPYITEPYTYEKYKKEMCLMQQQCMKKTYAILN